jgi:precorrin-2 methylase
MHHQDNLTRFNTDETLREFGDRKDTADLMKVEKIAVERLNDYLRAEYLSVRRCPFAGIQSF